MAFHLPATVYLLTPPAASSVQISKESNKPSKQLNLTNSPMLRAVVIHLPHTEHPAEFHPVLTELLTKPIHLFYLFSSDLSLPFLTSSSSFRFHLTLLSHCFENSFIFYLLPIFLLFCLSFFPSTVSPSACLILYILFCFPPPFLPLKIS